jgi:hypothetical protein
VRRYLQVIPLAVLLGTVVYAVSVAASNDTAQYLLRAGQLVLSGDNPYSINETQGPFLYPPISMFVFVLLALIPFAHILIIPASAAALIDVVRRLRVSHWWYLYAPVIICLTLGQTDLIAFWLAVVALQNKTRLSSLAMFAALCLKPQAALFVILPWWAQGKPARWWVVVFYAVGQLAGIQWWNSFISYASVRNQLYVLDSASLFPFGIVPGVIALIAFLIWGWDIKRARPLAALAFPIMRYYSMVGLIGAGAWWIGLLGGTLHVVMYVLPHLPLHWIEPALYLLGMAIGFSQPQARFDGDAQETSKTETQ